MFVPDKHFQHILLIVDKAGAYPRLEDLKGSLIGYNLALPTNNRLGWKGFPGTNTVAYYENL